MIRATVSRLTSNKYKPRNEKYNDRNIALIRRARLGDQRAMNDLILENERAVHAIARRYMGKGVEYDDLLQVGRMGILRAAKKFDLSRGVAFNTYATNWIRAFILEEIGKHSADIYVPRNTRELGAAIIHYRDRFTTVNGYNPTAEQIKSALVKAYTARFLAKHQRKPSKKEIKSEFSLFDEAWSIVRRRFVHQNEFFQSKESKGLSNGQHDRSPNAWYNLFPTTKDNLPEEQVANKEIFTKLYALKQAIEQEALNFRDIEKAILFERLWQRDRNSDVEEQVSLQSIAERFGLSRERIRQMEQKICHRLYKKYKLDQDMLECLPDIIFDYAARAAP